uniref:Uncharacterized protein n=1 Tax=Amphimedon queenslandica TaxID=400682 RepID=A0A1X7TK42_AMPQE
MLRVDSLTLITSVCLVYVLGICKITFSFLNTLFSLSRDKELFSLLDKAKAHVRSELPNDNSYADLAFWPTVKKAMNHLVMHNRFRCDGRLINDLRPIECDVDLFKELHGSSSFLRGETQMLSTVTFDCLEAVLKNLGKSRNFTLHYERVCSLVFALSWGWAKKKIDMHSLHKHT